MKCVILSILSGKLCAELVSKGKHARSRPPQIRMTAALLLKEDGHSICFIVSVASSQSQLCFLYKVEYKSSLQNSEQLATKLLCSNYMCNHIKAVPSCGM